MKLIATKGEIFNNNLEVIVKKSASYWRGCFNNNTCKIDLSSIISTDVVKMMISEFGFELTTIGKSENYK